MAETKITYATMTGDRMEDLHRELDRAIEDVRASLSRSHPLMIGGREVRAEREFDDRSPIDTRILLGTFQQASREQVREAITAAKAAFPAWRGRAAVRRECVTHRNGHHRRCDSARRIPSLVHCRRPHRTVRIAVSLRLACRNGPHGRTHWTHSAGTVGALGSLTIHEREHQHHFSLGTPEIVRTTAR